MRLFQAIKNFSTDVNCHSETKRRCVSIRRSLRMPSEQRESAATPKTKMLEVALLHLVRWRDARAYPVPQRSAHPDLGCRELSLLASGRRAFSPLDMDLRELPLLGGVAASSSCDSFSMADLRARPYAMDRLWFSVDAAAPFAPPSSATSRP